MRQSKPQDVATEPAIRKSKHKAFTAITLLFPVLLACLVEGTLRLAAYGPSLNLFTRETHNGTDYFVINQEVASRYFSRVDFVPSVAPDYFLAEKPDTTYRIFCLGGSTTAGFPYQFGGSFVSFLRDRLKAKFPERDIEVINLGMTATNSFTVLDFAEDLFDYAPDLLVVYDGHNEFYGALGVASNETPVSSRWLTRLYLKVVHLKTFLLLRDAYHGIAAMFRASVDEEPGGTMMERLAKGQYIGYGREKYRLALDIYKLNLEALKGLCAQHAVPVLVGSQVSNLRDQPPFVAEPAEGLSAEMLADFNRALHEGRQALRSGRFDEASRHLQAALAIDSLRADAQYLLARCYDSLGLKGQALESYLRARDYDMLRFRASSDLNAVMKSVADGEGMFFVDIERKFKANVNDSLIGNSLITEHLHPNAKGNFLIAKEFQWMMHWHTIMASQEAWNARAATSDERLWEERTITELDERAARKRIDILTSGWPFTDDERVVPAAQAGDTLGRVIDDWVRGNLTWEQAHVQAAQYYAARGDTANEIREYRTLMKLLPLNVSPYLFLAKAYLNVERNRDAASVLLHSLEVEKTWFAYKTLGILALDPPVAIGFFGNALALSANDDQRIESLYLLGAAHARNNERARAVAYLREALKINPDFTPARELLQVLSPSN